MHTCLHSPTDTPRQTRQSWWCLTWHLAAVLALGLILTIPPRALAKTFHCRGGDVDCLIDAINTANATGQENTIRLEAGIYPLSAVDNVNAGNNGLPSITSPLAITGAGEERTSIERDASAPVNFRLLHVAAGGSLTLKQLTLRGGLVGIGSGGGILNSGTLTLVHTTVIDNGVSFGVGGGIATSGGTVTITDSIIADNGARNTGGGLNISGGTVTLRGTTITGNFAIQGLGGGIDNEFNEPSGTVFITESAITNNRADIGAGILNEGTMVITNTTIATNFPIVGRLAGGGIGNSGGILFLTNSTVTDNVSRGIVSGEFTRISEGTVLLLNTLLAQNINNSIGSGVSRGPDCGGVITSLGHNLIGDPTGCTITLQPSDLTGDPGLSPFTDNGRPGNGHFPLLPTSQAIDAGNDAVCPRRDQLGQRRIDIPDVGTSRCDIGAVEFQRRDNQQLATNPATAAQANP